MEWQHPNQPPESPPPDTAPVRISRKRKRSAIIKISVALALLVIAVIAVAASVGGNGNSTAPAQRPLPVLTEPAPAPSSQEQPQFTPEQQQVLDAAESYLTDGQGFSKAGLLDQLTSSYGEGFSRRLAAFALSHLRVNWNRQAVLSAEGYLRSGQGFSYNGLVDQLESPYGEHFTPAQARYGARVALQRG